MSFVCCNEFDVMNNLKFGNRYLRFGFFCLSIFLKISGVCSQIFLLMAGVRSTHIHMYETVCIPILVHIHAYEIARIVSPKSLK